MFVWRVNRISEGDEGGRVAKSDDDVGRSFRCIIHPEVGNGKERKKRRRRRGRQETTGAVGWPLRYTYLWERLLPGQCLFERLEAKRVGRAFFCRRLGAVSVFFFGEGREDLVLCVM